MSSPLNRNSPHYRPDIDGLRAVAIIAVVVYHAFPKLVRGGFIGVDIFFVISGYLISSILIREYTAGDFSYLRFYLRRARRIFPALTVVLGFVAVAGWLLLWSQEYAQVGKHIAAGVAFVSNLILLGESGYFDLGAEEKPLLHLWSLGVEEQFYLLWPLVIALACRVNRLLVSFSLLILISFMANITMLSRYPELVFYLPLTRFWELAIGGLIAGVYARFGFEPWTRWLDHRVLGRLGHFKDWLATGGFLLVIAGFAFIRRADGFPGFWAVLPVSGTALLILSGPDSWISRKLLATRMMVYLGLVSYPLYLWHWPLLSLEYIVDNGLRNRQIILVMLAASLLLAHLTYRYVETPVRRSASTRPVYLLSAVLLCMGIWGLLVYQFQGFPQRQAKMPQLQLQMEADAIVSPGWEARCPSEVKADNETFCLSSIPIRHAPGIILAGDSHATAFTGGFKQLLEQRLPETGLIAISKGGCAPLLWLERQGNSGRCYPLYNQVFEYASTSSAETVVLVARWANKLSGKGFGEDEKTMRHQYVDVRLGDQQPDAAVLFRQGMEDTLALLSHAGKRVIFMHQVPELGFSPKSCIERPFSITTVRDCTIDRALVMQRQAPYRAVVAEVLVKYPEVQVFDPLNVLCGSDRCNARINDLMLYYDDDHLSLAGSRLIAEKLLDCCLMGPGAQAVK